jgi:hypothetical protein
MVQKWRRDPFSTILCLPTAVGVVVAVVVATEVAAWPIDDNVMNEWERLGIYIYTCWYIGI